MAAPSSSDSDLGRQLERIQSKIDQMEAAAGRTKMIGRLMTFVVAATAVIMVLLVVHPFWSATQNPKPFKDAFKKELEQRLAPVAQREVKLIVDEVVPAYQKAAQDAVEKRQGEVVGIIDREVALLVTNVKADLTGQMVAFQEHLVETQHERLKAEFPQLADPETAEIVVGRIQDLSERVSTRIVNDLFAVHFHALTELETTFNGFEVPLKVRNMSNDELAQHVTDLSAELLSAKLGGEEEFSVGGKPLTK